MKTKTLKLITLLVMVIVGLSACSKSTKETTDSFILPEGLKDCKLYNMYNGWTNVQVMRAKLGNNHQLPVRKNYNFYHSLRRTIEGGQD